MHQSGELEVHVRPDAFAIEAGKQRRRSRSVKTFAVKKDPDFQKTFLCSLRYGVLVKLLEMTFLRGNVKQVHALLLLNFYLLRTDGLLQDAVARHL